MDEQIILSSNRVRKSGDFTDKSTFSKEKAVEKFRTHYEVHWKKVLREVRKTSPRTYDAIDIYMKKNIPHKSRRNSPLPQLKPKFPHSSEFSSINTSLNSHNKPHNTTLPFLDTLYPFTPRPPKEQITTKRHKKTLNLMYRDPSTVSNRHKSRRSSPKGNNILNTLDEIKQMTMNMKEIIGNQTQKVIETSPSHLNKSVEFGSKPRMPKTRRNTKQSLNRSIETYYPKPPVPDLSKHRTHVCTSDGYTSRSIPKDRVDLDSIQQYFETFHKKSKMLLNQLEKNVLGSNKL